ncbi:unnamed protein product, partial [Scytosiphon promiscuus]
ATAASIAGISAPHSPATTTVAGATHPVSPPPPPPPPPPAPAAGTGAAQSAAAAAAAPSSESLRQQGPRQDEVEVVGVRGVAEAGAHGRAASGTYESGTRGVIDVGEDAEDGADNERPGC